MHKFLLIPIILLISDCLFCVKSFNTTDKDELWDLSVNGKNDDDFIPTTTTITTTDSSCDSELCITSATDVNANTAVREQTGGDNAAPEVVTDDEDFLADDESQLRNVGVPKKVIHKIRHMPTNLRPQPGQRSLVIVFDGTGSMLDDLEQLRHGAELIIAEITKKKDNPIYNYIFVPFRDPAIGPALITTQQDELMRELNNMTLWGGGDCPESALAGLKLALDRALPGSFVYVFTDAIAKDFKLDKEVLDLVQLKQTPITFLLTGFCNSKNSSGYEVFEKLASASNGQVYDLKKTDIAEVLESVRQVLDIKRVPLKSVDFAEAGQPHEIGLEVDTSLKEFSVSVAGNKPQVDVTDPNNQNYTQARSVLDLNNIRVVNVQDPIPGKWNIVASVAESESETGGGSVRFSGISEVTFGFGFAVEPPTDIKETTYRPLMGVDNVLAILPSDISAIGNLTHVTIESFVNKHEEADTKFQFPLLLKQVADSPLFTTDSFPPPRQMFKIFIHGFDLDGHPLERLLSTVITPIESSPPGVSFEQPKLEVLEFSSVHFQCTVTSLTPVTIQLKKSNLVLKEIEVRQSNVLEHSIPSALLKDSGRYTCTATNGEGTSEALATVSVKPRAAPVVNVYPQVVRVVEFEEPIEIHCSVANADETTRIFWLSESKALDETFVQANHTISILHSARNMTGTYSCHAVSYNHEIVDAASVTVEYPAFLLEPTSENRTAPYGSSLELTCRSEGLPIPTTNWYMIRFDTRVRQRLLNPNDSYAILSVSPDTEGEYSCEVENGIGERLVRTIRVTAEAIGPPKLQKTNKTYAEVSVGDDFSLTCKCERCKPLTSFGWSSETGVNLANAENIYEEELTHSHNVFELSLYVTNVSEAQQGVYKCVAVNAFGRDELTVELGVMVPPQIERLVTTNANESDSGEIAVAVGSSAHIKCVAKGTPVPIVTWIRDGVPILDTSNTNSLTIRDAQFHDAGVYSCQAINSLGVISREFNLLVLGPPSVVASKVDPIRSVIAGSSIELPCEIQAVPPPKITWLVNGHDLVTDERQVVVSNHSLLFDATDQDSGIYECRAKNEFGEMSQKFVLIIYTMPTIYSPTDEVVKVRSNSDPVMRCDASGNPAPEISWSVNGAKILNTNGRQKTGELVLTNVTEQDSGTYVCDAFNAIGTAQKVFYLVVYDPPKITSEFSDKLLFLPGQPIRLECEAFGNPVPKVYWTKDNAVWIENNVLELLPNNSKHNSGNYTCVAENSEGTDTRCVEIKTVTPPKMKRNINDALKRSSTNGVVDFVCPFDEYKQVTWFKDDIPITPNANPLIAIRGGTLTLQSTNADDQGYYTCFVENEAGRANYTFELQVNSPPSILPDKTYLSNDVDEEANIEITLLAGEDFLIDCKAEGNPAPEVSWVKDDVVVSERSELLLPSIIAEDEGIYTCVAENSEGQSQKSYHVSVMEKPTYTFGDLDQYIELNVGDDFTLDCTMGGSPHPVIVWSFEGKYLEEFQEILEYKYANNRQAGHYKCTGRNSVGSLEINFHVKIHEPPKIVHFTDTLNVNENATATLLCVVRGQPSPSISILHDGVAVLTTARIMQTDESLEQLTNYGEIVVDEFGNGVSLRQFQSAPNKMKKYGKLIKNGDQDELRFEYVISQTRRVHNGTYACVVMNALGGGRAESAIVVHVPPYMPENRRRNQNFEIVEGLPIILMCPLYGLPSPKITWTHNRQPITVNDESDIKILDHGTIFSVSQAHVNNTGRYECVATNKAGHNSLQFQVNVLVLPRFVGAPADMLDSTETLDDEFDPILVYTERGRNVELNCGFTGNPEPTVFWKKLDFSDTSNNVLLAAHGSVLNVTAVQDTASYSCYGNNTVGFKEKLFHVIVQTPPRFDQPFAEELNVNLYLGVNLDCKVSGNPEPSITWSRDGVDILAADQRHRYSVSDDDQILRILNAQKSDRGTYVCEAENLIGRAVKAFIVDVKVPVSWTPWQTWSACSASCGRGTQSRTRFCIKPNGTPANSEDNNCVGENVEVKICEIVPCPVNGGWSRWGSWSECPSTCVTGNETPVRRRLRRCNNPTPGLGGKMCTGVDSQEEACNLPFCPIDGGWTEWSTWSSCSSTCGYNGVTTRTRYCQNPLPQYGGAHCSGSAQESKVCASNKPCPIDGGWSHWSDWSACSKTCGAGVRQRRRRCDNPEPKYEGRTCAGDSLEFEKCFERYCKNNELIKQIRTDRNKYTPLMEFDAEDSSQEFRAQNTYEYSHGRGVEHVIGPILDRAVVKVENSIPITKDVVEINFNGGAGGRRSIPNPVNFPSTPETSQGCSQGFHFDDVLKRCEDTDECKLDNICKSTEQTCVNTPGGYSCMDPEVCQTGYRNVYGNCLDINECLLSLHGCSHYCQNTIGSYRCTCPVNLYLDESARNCVAVVFEKPLMNLLRTSSLVCPEGYESSNGECKDIDECQTDRHTCDPAEQTCLNTRGDFLCIPTTCPDDYRPTRPGSSNQCIQRCDRTSACLTQTMNYHVVSIANMDSRLPLLKLVNYDLADLPIERTAFDIIETAAEQSGLFRLEPIANKQGIVYVYANEGRLERERLYKFKVLGKSFDKDASMTFATISVVYVYVQK